MRLWTKTSAFLRGATLVASGAAITAALAAVAVNYTGGAIYFAGCACACLLGYFLSGGE